MPGFSDLAGQPLVIAAAALAILGLLFLLAGFAAIRGGRPVASMLRLLLAVLLMTLGALAATVAAGIQGYRAFTREEPVAKLIVRPTGPQRFDATLRFADGREERFALAGDELYVDAHILKWKPTMNLLGFHTAYELDRIAGRYRDIDQERKAPRTVFDLSAPKPVDLYHLRSRYPFLSPLVDAEYGSATFVPADSPAELELRISTTGLLIRPASGKP